MNKSLEALMARKGNAVTGHYFLAECENCGEMFSSERMTGDCYCPYCGADDSDIADCGAIGSDAVEIWNRQQERIDALIAALEQAQQSTAEHTLAHALNETTIEMQRQRIAELDSLQLSVSELPTDERLWTAVNSILYRQDEPGYRCVTLGLTESKSMANWLSECLPLRGVTVGGE